MAKMEALMALLFVVCSGQLVDTEGSTTVELKPGSGNTRVISGDDIRVLTWDQLGNRHHLQDLLLTDLPSLTAVQEDALVDCPFLRTIYISAIPQLKKLPPMPSLPSLRTLRIINSGLEEIPDLSNVFRHNRNALLHIIDLEGNHIIRLPSYGLMVRADQLILDYNLFEGIPAYAFNGSEISELSFKGNVHLTYLDEKAFAGMLMIRELDLSGTSITTLPTQGLEKLEVLRIENVPTLIVIPSIYEFRRLREARLTHHFHCCAFRFPERHDRVRHALYQKHLAHVKKRCHGQKDEKPAHDKTKRNVRSVSMNEVRAEDFLSGTKATLLFSKYWSTMSDEDASGSKENSKEEYADYTDSPNVQADMESWGVSDDDAAGDEQGVFLDEETKVNNGKPLDAHCGNITDRNTLVACSPVPDSLNPCEDVMGWRWLRVCVWLVVLAAVAGNVAVLVVLLANSAELTVPKFLMCHLAFADLCTGVYLLLLASIDLDSYSEYFNYAFNWQYGTGCKVAGFVSIFSGQLSIYTLAIITLERWFAIKFAIYLDKQIRIKTAAEIMLGGWVFALFMASLPLFGISDYSATSICLPVESKTVRDAIYQATLLITNIIGFTIIVVCYVQIYKSLGPDTRRGTAQASERRIAKKMSLLIATDFLCWAPVAFFGITALAGYPLVDVSHSKVLLVFFYPLNACANPFLYAILTQQYQRDFILLLARYGICTRLAHEYKTGASRPTSNATQPAPLIERKPCTNCAEAAL